MEVMTELSHSLQRSQLADSPVDDDAEPSRSGQEWNEDEMKFVNPALKLIEVKLNELFGVLHLSSNYDSGTIHIDFIRNC